MTMATWGVALEQHDRWQSAVRMGNALLTKGAAVFWALEAATAGERELAPGTLVVALSDPDDLGRLERLASHYDLSATELTQPPAGRMARLTPLRVAVYGSGGAPFQHMSVFNGLGFEAEFVTDQHVRRGDLAAFDVLVMPGGGWRAMNGQLDPLGPDGAEKIVDFVRNGGMYISSCAGSYDAAIAPQDFVDSCPTKACLNLINAKVWNDQGKEWVGLQSPGVGVWTLKNAAPEHPVMFGLPEQFEVVHYNGPLFEPGEGAVAGASQMFELASLAGLTDRFTPSEHFLEPGATEVPIEKTLAHLGAAESKSVVVGGYLGFGRVVLFGSHPELGTDPATYTAWTGAERMLANALLWQAGSHRPQARGVYSFTPLGEAVTSLALAEDLKRVQASAHEVLGTLTALSERVDVSKNPWWLDPGYSISFLGQSPREIWASSLSDAPSIVADIDRAVDQIIRLAQADRPVAQVERWVQAVGSAIHYRRADVWDQDAGYQGANALLAQAANLVALADQNVEAPAPDLPVSPYQHFMINPFYLVAGVYLSAIGTLGCVKQLLESFALQLRETTDTVDLLIEAGIS